MNCFSSIINLEGNISCIFFKLFPLIKLNFACVLVLTWIECDVNIDCLRSKTTAEIQTATFGVRNALLHTYGPIALSRKLTQLAEPFAPVIDGKIVKNNPFEEMVKNSMSLIK